MSGPPEQIIQLGFDNVAAKYYAFCANALYFYDYFLMLPDEVEYAWRGKKTWLFYLFILNRYITMFYVGWLSVALTPIYPYSVCKRTSIIELVYFVCATSVAQVFLIARIYALTRGDRIVAGFFATLATIQMAFGIVFLTSPDNGTLMEIPIKLEAYHSCSFTSSLGMESGYMSLSLSFDFFAFVTVVVLAYRSNPSGSAKQRLFTGITGTVVRGAIIYFALIFVSHLILVMFIYFAKRQTLKLLPASGCILFLPIMVSRLYLSLKKSGDSRHVAEWNQDHFTHIEVADPVNFAMQPVENPTGQECETQC